MNYIFLLLITLGFYSVSNKINYYFYKNNENIIVNSFIFSFVFVLIYIINSYLFLLNIDTKYFSYLFIFASMGICFHQRKEIFNYLNIFKKFYVSKNKFLILILFFYFLIILLPPADEDSLRYHLEIGKKLNNGSFYSNIWLDYIGLGAHEFINSFSLHLKFENISSYTNFVYLVFAIISNIYILKKYKQGSGILSGLILLSSPYLIALVSSQKFYFFPCYIVSYSIAYLYLEKKINLLLIYLILILNIFCVIIKPTFLPYLVLVSMWLFFKENSYRNKILYVIFLIIISIFFYTPIFIIKLKIFNDPFLPYISINKENINWLSDFNYYLTSFNMDFTDGVKNSIIKYFLIPLKLIMPLQASDLFKTLGLGIIFLFSINYKKNKYLISLLIFFIIAVVLLNNFQSRWFLPLLIFICIFADVNKFKFFKKLSYVQLFGAACILVPLGFICFASNIGLINKNFVLDKFFNSYKMISYINKNYKDEKVFSELNYYYYFDNIVPVYYPKMVNKFDSNFYKNNENSTKLILWDSKRIKRKENEKTINKEINSNFERAYLIDFVDQNFKCKNLKKIEEFDFRVGRNFLKKNKVKFSLYRLSC